MKCYTLRFRFFQVGIWMIRWLITLETQNIINFQQQWVVGCQINWSVSKKKLANALSPYNHHMACMWWTLAVLLSPDSAVLHRGEGGDSMKSSWTMGLLFWGGEPNAGNCCRFSNPMCTSGSEGGQTVSTGRPSRNISPMQNISRPSRKLNVSEKQLVFTFPLLLVLLHLDAPLPTLLIPRFLLPEMLPLLQVA